MYHTKQRLTEADFKVLYGRGRRCQGVVMNLIYCKNNLGFNRFGVVVANKISNKASERNLLKRRIRYYLRKLNKKVSQGHNLAIVAKAGSLGEEPAGLKNELIQLLAKAGLSRQE